jgi:V/A-type H+/Na+-transporting ATPase subunit D
MAEEKIKLNKTELKRQKDLLKQRQEFLPVLELKKQQLQQVVDSIKPHIQEKLQNIEDRIDKMSNWYQFLSEEVGFPLNKLFEISKVDTTEENIAGVDVPNFETVEYKDYEYDLFLTPAWLDFAQRELRELTSLREEVKILKKKRDLLSEELRQTTIRVNLFEKILIPQHKENIKKIKIFLADMEVFQISIAKIAKSKSEESRELMKSKPKKEG